MSSSDDTSCGADGAGTFIFPDSACADSVISNAKKNKAKKLGIKAQRTGSTIVTLLW
jgi:hypothetical protein